jgi:ribonuclease III
MGLPADETNPPQERPTCPLMQLVEGLPPALLAQALTHSSWVERRTDSYERLEFLGDSVLGLAVAAHLYRSFPDEQEGRLAKIKAYAVSRGSCSVVADILGLATLVFDHAPASEVQRAELAGSPAALGNMVEALIGACFLSYGFDATREAVVDAFTEQIAFGASVHVDYKSTLQEHLAATNRRVSYRLVGESGPAHDRLFASEAVLDDAVIGRGEGRSIKISEQQAAREALTGLGVLASAGDSTLPSAPTD